MYLITIYLLKKQTYYAESTCSSNLEFNDKSVSPNKMSFTSPEESDPRNQEDTTPKQTPFIDSELIDDRRCLNGPRGNDNSNDKLRSIERTEINHTFKEKTDRNDPIQGNHMHKSETEGVSLSHDTCTDSERDSFEGQEPHLNPPPTIIVRDPSNIVHIHENVRRRSTHRMGENTNVQIDINVHLSSDREKNLSNKRETIRTRIDIEENTSATDAAFSVSNRDGSFEGFFRDNDSIIEKQEKGSIILQIRPLSENSVRKLLDSIDNGDFDLTIQKLLSHESVFKHIRGKNVIVKVDLTIPEELLAKEGIVVIKDPQYIHFDAGSDGCVSEKQNDNDDLSTESELTSSPDSVPQEANTGETNGPDRVGGESGTVTTLQNNCEVRVTWDDGTRNKPRAGKDGRYDLHVFDSGPVDRNDPIKGYHKHNLETEGVSLSHDSESDSSEEQGRNNTAEQQLIMIGASNTVNIYENFKVNNESGPPNKMSFTSPEESDPRNQEDTTPQQTIAEIMYDHRCPKGTRGNDNSDDKLRSLEQAEMNHTIKEKSGENPADRIDIPTFVEQTEVKADEKIDTDDITNRLETLSLPEACLDACTDRNDPIQGDDNRSLKTESMYLAHDADTHSQKGASEEQERHFTSLRPIIMSGPSNILNIYENGSRMETICMKDHTIVKIIYNVKLTSADSVMNRSNRSGNIGAEIDIEENPPANDAAFSVSNRVRFFENLIRNNGSVIEKVEKGSIVLEIRPLSENSVRKLLQCIDNGDFDLTIEKLLSHESVFKHIKGKNVIVKVDLTIPQELLAKEGIEVIKDPQFVHIDAESDVCVSVKQNDNDDDLSTESELTSSHDSLPQEANTGETNESRTFLYKTFSGLRVVRGPDCIGGESGRDESIVGTVTTLENNCEVRVTWDDGTRSTCRAGKDGRYDLRVFDSGPVGINHKGVTCSGCGTKDFFGTRWTCKQCKSTNLCFLCYSGDKHDLDHVFRRHDLQGDPGIEVNKRRTSKRIQSIGQFPGAKVMRGEDWKWGQQDGGEGKTGHIESEVESRENFTSIRNVVRVKWDNGQSNMYRVGHDGRMDLKCIETAPGPCYYKEHMPLLDVSDVKKDSSNDTNLVPGCKVCIHLEEQELKHIQNQNGEWSAGLVECIGRTGLILDFPSDDVANVGFGSTQYNIARKALSKVHEHSEQDVVRIMTNKKKVELLQRGHGGWTDKMEMVLGKVGRVALVDKDGDVVVVFGSIMWFFNAACCIPAPGERVDDLQMETSIPDLEGLLHQLQQLNDMLTKLVKVMNDGAKPDSKDIHTAVLTGDVESVKSFLKANPNKVNERMGDLTPLVIACHSGHKKIVNILLEHGADMEVKVHHGATALAFAIIGKKEDIVKTLIDYGANMKVALGNGQTLLRLAVSLKLWTTLRLFLDNGSDVNELDTFKDTPLHDAILSRSDKCIEVLLGCPDLNLRLYNSRNFNQLQLATLRNNVFAVEKIIEKDKSLVDLLMADGSFCALHIAAANDHVECARFLIDKGNATVDRKGKGGLTALHVAAATNNYRMIELLLDKGADVNHCDALGDTPLHALFFVSTMKKYEHGIFGKTSSTGEEERISTTAFMLLEKQADFTLKNMFGFTPLDLCLSEKVKSEVRNFIEEHNGSFNSEGRADTFPKQSPFRSKTDEQNLLSALNMSSPPFKHLMNKHLTTLADLEHIDFSSKHAVKNVPMLERSILQ